MVSGGGGAASASAAAHTISENRLLTGAGSAAAWVAAGLNIVAAEPHLSPGPLPQITAESQCILTS